MEPKTTKKPSRKLVVFKRELPFYLMLIPGVTFLIIFSYLPMFGLVMAFQDFTPLRSFKNSPWVGLKNFRDMLALPTFWNVVGNTLSISIAKIILRLLVPLILALLLNEVVHPKFMRMAQTVFFLPYFLSWAVMGGVLRNLFQYDGMVNELLGRIGIDPIMFLGSNTWFPIIIILSDVWKDMGYNMIIFLAAITGVDPALNESAALDGANRWQQIWHITLPTIRPIVVMLLVLSLGSVLSAGMEQIMLLYNPMVYKSSDIIDACGDVIYGSCFENGLYFAVDSALTRILWQFQPAGANAHWVQSVGHALFLADLGNSRLYRLALENNLPTGSGPRQVLDAGDGMLDCVYELDGHMRVLNHDGCTVSTVQASTVPKPRSWPGGACATADGTLFVSNRGPNTISAWQRSGPTRHFLCEWPTGDWPRALCAVPGTLYLLAACQREGAVHCYYCLPLPHRAPTETASLALPGASCALVLD